MINAAAADNPTTKPATTIPAICAPERELLVWLSAVPFASDSVPPLPEGLLVVDDTTPGDGVVLLPELELDGGSVVSPILAAAVIEGPIINVVLIVCTCDPIVLVNSLTSWLSFSVNLHLVVASKSHMYPKGQHPPVHLSIPIHMTPCSHFAPQNCPGGNRGTHTSHTPCTLQKPIISLTRCRHWRPDEVRKSHGSCRPRSCHRSPRSRRILHWSNAIVPATSPANRTTPSIRTGEIPLFAARQQFRSLRQDSRNE